MPQATKLRQIVVSIGKKKAGRTLDLKFCYCILAKNYDAS